MMQEKLAHALLLCAQNAARERDDIATLQMLRRLHAQAYAFGRAGDDYVARQERHELAEI